MVGRILGATLAIAFRAPRIFVLGFALIVIAYIGNLIVNPILPTALLSSTIRIQNDLGYALVLLALGAAYQIISAAVGGVFSLVIVKIAAAEWRSERLGLRAALAEAARRWPPLMRYTLFVTAVTTVAVVGFGALMLGSVNRGVSNAVLGSPALQLSAFSTLRFADPLMVIVLLIFNLFNLWWSIANALAAPVIALEGVGGVEAFRSSWRLTRRTWYVFLVPVAVLMVFGCLAVALAALFSVVTLTPLNTINLSTGAQSVLIYGFFFVVITMSVVFTTVWYLEAVARQSERDAETMLPSPAQTGDLE